MENCFPWSDEFPLTWCAFCPPCPWSWLWPPCPFCSFCPSCPLSKYCKVKTEFLIWFCKGILCMALLLTCLYSNAVCKDLAKSCSQQKWPQQSKLVRNLSSFNYTFCNLFSFIVLGEQKPESLGKTFTHEHLSMTFEFSYRAPYENEKHMIECPWTLENSGWIQQWP